MQCCRKRNAASAATPAANPMQKPSPKARPTSTSALRAVRKVYANWPICSAWNTCRFGEGAAPKAKAVAFIDEQTCIGCTLCLQACPVDAIVGAAKQMHTIIASECTGCELCVAPCPVDCISMLPLGEDITSWKWDYPTIPIVQVAAQ